MKNMSAIFMYVYCLDILGIYISGNMLTFIYN